MSLRFAGLSALISISAALVLFLAQFKLGIVSDVSNFLILGKDNLTTLQRELGYDSLVGYDYAEKHLRDKFGFVQTSVHEQYRASCLLRSQVNAANDSIDVCLNLSSTYSLIKPLETLRGTKILVLEKPHRFIGETFLNFAIVILGIVFLFSVLFLWGYREVMRLVFHPFYGVYEYLKENDESKVDVSLLEVNELYDAIKERSKMELDLAELEKNSAIFRAIATTTQMLAHDIRRPMDMVTKFVRRASTLSNEQLTTYAKNNASIIDKATTDAYGMLEDLINFSPDKTVVFAEGVDLEAFFSEVTSEFPEVAVRTVVNSAATHTFDRLKMKRVLINILKNAVEATHSRGSYWIEARNDPSGLQIEIGNSGSSIPSDRLTKIFEPFFTSGKATGHGLGMAIAKKFTEDHGGEIWCESNGCSTKEGSLIKRREEDYVVFGIQLSHLK